MNMNENDFETRHADKEEDVIAFYDFYANHWDDRFGGSLATRHFLGRRYKSFKDVLDYCKVSCSQAVELGVGTGVYVNNISKIFRYIVAVDGSENMLNKLLLRLDRENVENVSALCRNVIDLHGIGDGFADCVYFFGLIEHVIDHDRFAKEIRRILKPGGVVIGVTPNGSSPWYSLRRLVRGTGKHCSSDVYHTEDSLDGIFIPVGFRKVVVSHWGMTPAGVGELVAKILISIEPFFEKSPLRCWLGGLTFAYRNPDIKK